MIDETAGADTPAAEEALAPDATDVDSAPSTEQQPEADEAREADAAGKTGEEPGDDAADKPKRKHWAHERIDELTRQKHEFARQAEYWKAKAQKPANIDELEYDDQLAERVASRTRQEQAESAQHAALSVTQQIFEAREAEARDRYPDYDAVTRNPSLAISTALLEVLFDSDQGADIAYHLGKNPAEAVRLSALSQREQAKAIGRLEERFSAPKPLPKVAPAPVSPVGGQASGGVKDPSKMSMAEYVAWRNSG